MKNKESLGESGGGGVAWDMSDLPKNPVRKEALPSDVLGESSRRPEAMRETVNNDPAENEAVLTHLEGAKGRMVKQLESEALQAAFNKLGNPEASPAEVAKNAEMAEVLRAEVFLGMALDGAEMYAEATGGSICDGIRKQMEMYDKRLEKAGKEDAIQQAAWSDAKHWGELLLDQMGSYSAGGKQGEALPSDIL